MFLKRTSLLIMLFAVALAVASAAAAAPAPGHAAVLIRHQTQGCHSWAVDGGAFKASQSTMLQRGGSMTVTNSDVMPHTLVLTSGPSLKIPHATMSRMGASVRLTFTRPGVYRFTTKAGEDYMAGVKTVGPDNVLKLKVVVS